MGNQAIRLKIDGMEVEVATGKTILDAAQAAGVRIPTLCHDRRLIPFGACRLCVVQQKGKSELLPACFTPARGGMEIVTQSPEIAKSRRLQLQLILLNHPMICPRCEKEGECDLQSLVYEYGVEETRYPWEKIPFPPDDLSSLLQRDPNKCILCGRCVRICDEVQGVGELSFTERGIQTAIDTDFHRPIHCEFCGQCLDTCPVGAITTDRFDTSVKAWELTETTTPCPYCSCGCYLTFGSKEGAIKRVFSDPGPNRPNDGNLCVKGRFGWDFVDHPDRIKTPLLRVNGTFKEASWEEALRFMAQRLEEVKEKHGPDAIAGVASSRLTNEEYYLFQTLFRKVIGTDQIDQESGSSDQGLTEGLAETLGFAASTNSIREVRKADCILVISTDPAETHPIIKNEIHLAIRRNRAQLIVLGVQDIGLTRATHTSPLSPPSIVLQEKPGMEVSLLNAMVHTILEQGLEDKPFIEGRTEGFEPLKKKMSRLDLRMLSEETRREVENAARAFAKAKRAMILIGSGLGSSLHAKEIAIAASNLALITGHIGKESSGVLILLETCNSQGALDMGVFRRGDKGSIMNFSNRTEERSLKALYAVGVDPVTDHADSDRLKKILQDLPLLVVQDLFMTETAKIAHVVLPACAFAEKGGTMTNLERRVQKLNPLRPPQGESRSDFDIFSELLRVLEGPVPGKAPDEVFERICQENPLYRGIQDGEQWPGGIPYLYADGFPTGKAKLIPVEAVMAPPAMEGYPFCLVQRPSLFRSGLLSSKSEALEMVSERPHLEMNPGDAQRIDLADGETVQVSVPGGRSLKMKVKYSSKVFPGVTTVPCPSSLVDERGMGPVKIEKVHKK